MSTLHRQLITQRTRQNDIQAGASLLQLYWLFVDGGIAIVRAFDQKRLPGTKSLRRCTYKCIAIQAGLIHKYRMQLSAPYDARAVANLLLDLADVRQLQLTQVSLLKLLYFAHGWYLANTGNPLIKQDFEAWKYGPVVKVVRDEFKGFGKGAITSRATRLDLLTSKRVTVAPDVRPEDVKLVEAVMDAYHRFDAWQLSELTHEAGSPWDRIWNSSEPTGRLALRIRNEDIQQHFLTVPQRFHLS